MLNSLAETQNIPGPKTANQSFIKHDIIHSNRVSPALSLSFRFLPVPQQKLLSAALWKDFRVNSWWGTLIVRSCPSGQCKCFVNTGKGKCRVTFKINEMEKFWCWSEQTYRVITEAEQLWMWPVRKILTCKNFVHLSYDNGKFQMVQIKSRS